jgi:hypothetical protein
MVSEMLVDWLKHAFITKFNHIRPSVYERFTDVLCRDLASGSAVGRRGARKVSLLNSLHTCRLNNMNAAHLRRSIASRGAPIGIRLRTPSSTRHPCRLPIDRFDVLRQLRLHISLDVDSAVSVERGDSPLFDVGCDGGTVLVMVCAFHLPSYFFSQLMVLCSFVVIKVIIGVNLISYATRRRSGMEARELADVVNDFGRDPIGEGKEEQVGSRFISFFPSPTDSF